ncbi:hypothetical protein HMPREF0201_03569 [Cedecea davisae DSM 4568]|uniref:Uncharacterized protein n=1 Tax=Cedecea davisae DSM 4568 TaxID=566551 RepID=S3J5Q7_9ENTR|nr:hypothetical protein HMPREF0201_03569 [Cedecea davisae DSM 4568]
MGCRKSASGAEDVSSMLHIIGEDVWLNKAIYSMSTIVISF